jgi:hypothetical protein
VTERQPSLEINQQVHLLKSFSLLENFTQVPRIFSINSPFHYLLFLPILLDHTHTMAPRAEALPKSESKKNFLDRIGLKENQMKDRRLYDIMKVRHLLTFI